MAELVVSNKQYVYLKIPTKYIALYHKLMNLMVKLGEDMLKDCKADCASRNVEITKCFNMFNAALFARELGKTKHEETYIKFLTAKLNQIQLDDIVSNFTITLEDGTTGYVDCSKNPPVIYVDPEEEVVENAPIIYGVIKPSSYAGYTDYNEYAQDHIHIDSLINPIKRSLKKGNYSYECVLNESKLMFVALIPTTMSASVKIDDGFGNKVVFGSSGTWFSNGNVKLNLDGVEYSVFGELYPISGNIKFYIDVV